jgi:hypothetical protein
MKYFLERYKITLQVLILSILTWSAYIIVQLVPIYFFDVNSESIKNNIIFISMAIVMIQVGQTIGIQLAMSESRMLSFLSAFKLNTSHLASIIFFHLFVDNGLAASAILIVLLLIFLFQGLLISRDYSQYIFDNQATKYYLVVLIRNLVWMFLFVSLLIFFENIYLSFITSFLFANILSRYLIKPMYKEENYTNSKNKNTLLFISFAAICSLAYRNDTNVLRSYIAPIDFEFFHILLTLFSGLVAMLGIVAVTFFAPKIKSGQFTITQIKRVTMPLFLFNTVAIVTILSIQLNELLSLIIFFAASFLTLLLSSFISVYLHTQKPSIWVYTSGLVGIIFLIFALETFNASHPLELFLIYLYFVSVLLFSKFVLDARNRKKV